MCVGLEKLLCMCVCVCAHAHTYIICTYIHNKQKKYSYKITRIQHSLSKTVICLNAANTLFTKSNLCYITLKKQGQALCQGYPHVSYSVQQVLQ